MTTENEAIGKMVRDYQTVLTRLSCIANELHAKATIIERVTSQLKDEPANISAVASGFKGPSDFRFVVEDEHILPLSALSIESLHQDLNVD